MAKTNTSSGLLKPKAFLLATLTLYLEGIHFKGVGVGGGGGEGRGGTGVGIDRIIADQIIV